MVYITSVPQLSAWSFLVALLADLGRVSQRRWALGKEAWDQAEHWGPCLMGPPSRGSMFPRGLGGSWVRASESVATVVIV